MLYTNLGRTGLRVSRLGLGTMNLGSHVDEAGSHAILDAALEHGLNLVDTADIYGRRAVPDGTEAVIGRWLAAGADRRDRVVLATKVYGRTGDGPNDRGLSARHIIAACEASLRRLRTDWIDVYQMHHVDRTVGWEEIWQAMSVLVAQGKVRYVGSSNFAGWHLATAQAAAGRHPVLGLASEQCLYNLFTRHVELEVIPAATALGIGVLPWSPLQGGLLSGASRRTDGVRSAADRVRGELGAAATTIAEYEALCDEAGLAPPVVALAWLLGRPGVTAPIVGPRTVAQLAVLVEAVGVRLDDAVTERLERLFPAVGKGGPAPEAWAW